MATQAEVPKLFGVDLSHANMGPDGEEIDLHGLIAAGSISFIPLKATEGRLFVDPTFVDRFKRIVEYFPNVQIIAYHFLRTDSPAPDQMQHFYDVLKSVDYFEEEQTLAAAIDSERGLQGQEPDAALVEAAIAKFKELSGSEPGLYSDLSHLQGPYANIDAAYDWGAAYRDVEPDAGFDIWQDSESRVINGQPYDHNVFYGTVDQMREKCGK